MMMMMHTELSPSLSTITV